MAADPAGITATTPTPTAASIIIAAHNECAVISRCLHALGDLIAGGTVQVIVVCNGCSDDTARIARAHPGVTVLELAVASKVAALRAGDRIAPTGPRIYLDADVVMTSRAAEAVIHALHPGRALAARPPIRFDTAGASWAVRRWYVVRERLPSIRTALWGAGTYALSEAGRARFGEFPEIVSDDLFVDRLVTPAERVVVLTDPVIVHTPQRLPDLLKILKRSYRTQSDVITDVAAGPVSSGQREQLDDLRALLREDPRRGLDVAVYVAIILTARVRARLTPATSGWERDDSSRVVNVDAAAPGPRTP